MIKIKIKVFKNKWLRLRLTALKIKINLYENLMITIKLHSDYISIKMKLNYDYKKIAVWFLFD